MGFDITFHPLSLEDAQYFVFDVLDEPRLAHERLAALTRVPEKQQIARAAYETLLNWRDPRDWTERGPNFGRTVAFIIAAVAGFLRPYWYSRSGAVSFHAYRDPRVSSLFCSWTKLGRGHVACMPDDSGGLLLTSYHGSGYVPPERLADLESVAL